MHVFRIFRFIGYFKICLSLRLLLSFAVVIKITKNYSQGEVTDNKILWNILLNADILSYARIF